MTPATRSLLRAAADGDAGLVRALLAQGTDVNSKTAAGQTPLMLAAAFGHEKIVALLLAAGADTESQDELGLSAKEWSARSNAVSFLINPPVAPIEEPETTHVSETERDPLPAFASTTPPAAVAVNQPSPTVESLESVVFPRPKPAGVRAEPGRTGLGGLAGAILRDRAVKPFAADEIVSNPPFSEPRDIPIPSRTEQTEDETPLPSSPIPDPSPIPSLPDESEITPVLEPVHEVITQKAEPLPSHPRQIVSEEPDENTLAGKRARVEPEVVDTVSTGRTLIPRQPVMHEEHSVPTTRVSKVQVQVPSFSTGSEMGGSRPVKWVLVVLFLAAGAAGGYFLSDYVLRKNAARVVTPLTQPVTQPVATATKPGPIVGGSLQGAELFLPDVDYPPGVENLSGKVTIAIEVDQHGTVTATKAMDGDERLQRPAIAAALRAAFSPEKIKGKGRFVSGTITYEFVAPSQTSSQQSTASSSPGTNQPTPVPSPVGVESSSPTVSGALAGSELNLPQPDYPARLKSQGVVGTVAIVVRVNRSGRVVSWRTEQGDSRLRSYALAAAKKSTFSPEKLSGAGDVVGTLTYTFK